jgi:hypothetical protein
VAARYALLPSWPKSYCKINKSLLLSEDTKKTNTPMKKRPLFFERGAALKVCLTMLQTLKNKNKATVA